MKTFTLEQIAQITGGLLSKAEDAVITMESAVLYELSLSNYDVEKLTNEIYMLTPKNSVNKKGTYL